MIQRRENDPKETFNKKVEAIVLHCWNKITTRLHLLGYTLSPKYYSAEVLVIPSRVPPYRDVEVANGYKRELSRVFSYPKVRLAVRREFGLFILEKDLLPLVINDQSRMDTIIWRYLHGQYYVYLQPLSIKILL